MANQILNTDNDNIQNVVVDSWVDDAPCPPDWIGAFTEEFTEEFI